MCLYLIATYVSDFVSLNSQLLNFAYFAYFASFCDGFLERYDNLIHYERGWSWEFSTISARKPSNQKYYNDLNIFPGLVSDLGEIKAQLVLFFSNGVNDWYQNKSDKIKAGGSALSK